MGFILLPLIVLSFFLGINAIERSHAQSILPQAIVIQAELAGQAFVAYRNAVAVYQKNNPTFTGTVSTAVLAAQGSSVASSFLANASNKITSTGVAGRVVTCYAALPTGAITIALSVTENDASLGMSTGSAWTSSANGSITPLATSVPDGYVVSVIQIGN